MVPEKVRQVLGRIGRSRERAMCGVQFKDRKRADNMIYVLDLDETIDQLAVANSLHWYGHVLKREDGHVFGKALETQVEGQREKGGRRGHERGRLRRKA